MLSDLCKPPATLSKASTNKPERVNPFVWCTCQLSRYEINSVLAKGVAIHDRTRFQLLGSETLVRPLKSEIHQATDD